MSNKQKECYWDKSIDMSKATLQVDGKVVCKFDNDNQTIIVNEGFKTLRELELEARVKDLEERIINHSNTVEEYCSRLANKDKECEELKKEIINKNEKIKELRFSVSDLTNRLCYLNAEKSFRIVDLEQTLDEIEKELKEDIYCENQECGCDDFEECLKCTKEYILDIINKAKDGE